MEDKVLTDEEKEKLRKERRKRRKYRLLILLLLLLLFTQHPLRRPLSRSLDPWMFIYLREEEREREYDSY